MTPSEIEAAWKRLESGLVTGFILREDLKKLAALRHEMKVMAKMIEIASVFYPLERYYVEGSLREQAERELKWGK